MWAGPALPGWWGTLQNYAASTVSPGLGLLVLTPAFTIPVLCGQVQCVQLASRSAATAHLHHDLSVCQIISLEDSSAAVWTYRVFSGHYVQKASGLWASQQATINLIISRLILFAAAVAAGRVGILHTTLALAGLHCRWTMYSPVLQCTVLLYTCT